MGILTLAAVSLTIAVSLMISRNKTPLHLSFAWLCMALFVYKGAQFSFKIYPGEIFRLIEAWAFLVLPLISLTFTRMLLNQQTFLHKRYTLYAVVCSTVSAVVAYLVIYTELLSSHLRTYLYDFMAFYISVILAICYCALLVYLKTKTVGTEKKRMVYLAVASGVAMSIVTLTYLTGANDRFSFYSDIMLAVTLYLILMIITHPQLTTLHDIMIRTVVVFFMSGFTALIFSVFTGLFWTSSTPFSHILVASFIIVISMEPFRLILKKILIFIHPDSPDVFTSLYAFDERLEREKSRLLEEMAPVLAHEIRNPLASMKGAAQYLHSEVENKEHQKLLDVIIEEVDRLNGVVSQFLNYAKPFQLNRSNQMLNPVVEKAITIIRARNLSDKVNIEQELRPDLPTVYIDAEQIIQVILNIAFNAIESMQEGGTLTFRTSQISRGDAHEAVGLSIRDTGKGIKREDIKNIFKPFYTTKERGVGLGLAICQRIIKSHGGRLRLKSIPDQGSIFYIRLNSSKQ